MSLQTALKFTLQWEGGFSDNPRDKGGATNYGITQATYDHWQDTHGGIREDVRNITVGEVEAIYEEDYWKAAHCHELPDRLAGVVFDSAVNEGVGRATQVLQACLGVAPDGVWGAHTAAALDGMDEDGVIREYLDRRRDHYEEIVERNPPQAIFLRGWLRRVDGLEEALRHG